LRTPSDLLERAHYKNPSDGAQDADGAGYREGPEELSGSAQHKTCQCRRYNACEIANKILQTSPFAGD
jgi:hypothetical protein